MSSNLITQPYGIILDPTGGGGRAKPVANGRYHVGIIDLDPVANPRTDLAYKDESGTERPLTSPLILNNSGAFVVSENDGTLIQPYMKQGLGHSVLITDKRGTPVYSDNHVGDPGNITEIVSSANLIPNSDFSIAGSVANAPDATPRSYADDDELFQGFKAVGALSGVTYVNGKLNGTGQLYVNVYKSEKEKLSTAPHVASIASSDGVPVESGASFVDNGDYWRVTFDMSETFSVKFEQGSVATSHGVVDSISDIERSTIKTFDTLQAAVNSKKIINGILIRLKERETGKGGGGIWQVKSSGTVSSSVVASVGVPGLFLHLMIFNDTAKSSQFGAFDVGDAYTALKDLNLSSATRIEYEGVEFTVSDTVPFPSKKTYRGVRDKTKIIGQAGLNKPTAASESWISSFGVSPTGFLDMDGITFSGDITQPLNDGFVLRDFYSTLKNIEIEDVGGKGLKATINNDSLNPVSGNLVENRLKDISIRRTGDTQLFYGEDNNNKLTDFFMENIILDTNIGLTDQMFIGSSAGANIKGVHTYGKAVPINAITLRNAFSTQLDGIYIEKFQNVGINAKAIQRSLQISNANLIFDDSIGGAASGINLERSGSLEPEIAISNVSGVLDENKNVDLIKGVTGTSTQISNMSKEGLYKDNINLTTGAGKITTHGSQNETAGFKGDLTSDQAGIIVMVAKERLEIDDVVLSVASNGADNTNYLSVAARVRKNGLEVTTTPPKIDKTAASASFATTSKPGTGITQAVIKTDGTQDLEPGDILTVDFITLRTSPTSEINTPVVQVSTRFR